MLVWLVPHGVLNLLSHSTQATSLRATQPAVNWALPHQSSIQKTHHMLHGPAWWGHLFS